MTQHPPVLTYTQATEKQDILRISPAVNTSLSNCVRQM